MESVISFKKLIVSAILVSLLVACAGGYKGSSVLLKPSVIDQPMPTITSQIIRTESAIAARAAESLNDAAPIAPMSSLYYPLNVATVQDDGKPIILSYAKYLAEHPDQKVRVEGNADERGSRIFNLALGQRRADSVMNMLVLAGAKASQIDAVSFGEEKPKQLGHDEAAWRENRRSDILLLKQTNITKAEPPVIAEFRDCEECPDMVVIPSGSFAMGSNNGEHDEIPVHQVNISHPFAMGKTEVTQGQWRALMGNNPSIFSSCGDTCPVEQVSWQDAQEYIQKLNEKTGQLYRLPSEAEWEFACRAAESNEYCGSENKDSVAWYGAHAYPVGNSDKTTNPVASRQANAFGLFDMSGNVWEWVEDGYHINYSNAPDDGSAWVTDSDKHVLRGGSWDNYPQYVRASVRGWDESTSRTNFYGFRVVRVLPK